MVSRYHLGRVRRKGAFDHTQYVQIHIILYMRNVASGHLKITLHRNILQYQMILFAASDDPDQAEPLRRLI